MESIAASAAPPNTSANNGKAHETQQPVQTIVVKIEWPSEPLQIQMVPPPPPPVRMSYTPEGMGNGHILWGSTGDWGTKGDRWTPEDWELAPQRFSNHWNPEFRPNPYKGEVLGWDE